VSTPELNLLIALRSRKECCRSLCELSRRQIAFIEADDHGELLQLLQHKQSLIDELTGPGSDHVAPWEQWEQMREHLPSEIHEACVQALEETRRLMKTLMQQEEMGTQLLTTRREANQRELAAVSAGGRAHAAYHQMEERPSQSHFDFQT